MKTAIYIEDGVVQLILTPQNEFEKNTIKSITNKDLSVNTFNGSFYDCRGGWIRQEIYYHQSGFGNQNYDKSIMIRIEEKEPVKEEQDIEPNLKIIEVSKEKIIHTPFSVFPETIKVLNIENLSKQSTAEYKIQHE